MPNLTIEFHEFAREEISDAYNYYENKQFRLGIKFFDAIEDTLDLILEHPEAFPLEFDTVRKAVVKKFPFIILFTTATDSVIYVVAVFHTGQAPSKWKKRLT